MTIKAQLDTVLKTIEDAVQKHLEKEQLRIKNLSEDIFKSSSKVSQASEKNKILIEEITNATEELQRYNPMTIFEDLRNTAEAAASSPEQDDGFKEVLTDEELEAEKEKAKAEAADRASAEARAAEARASVEAAVAMEKATFKDASDGRNPKQRDSYYKKVDRKKKSKEWKDTAEVEGGRKQTRRRRRHSFRRK